MFVHFAICGGRQHGMFDNDGFSLHRHKIVPFVTIKLNNINSF